jgi:hypothetical protein
MINGPPKRHRVVALADHVVLALLEHWGVEDEPRGYRRDEGDDP